MVIKRKLEKKITLGFKILSGHYTNGITKKHISTLAEDERIPWGQTTLEDDINKMGNIILRNHNMKFWNSWSISMMEAMSDAIAINYTLVMVRDWINKDRPENPLSTKYVNFQKNSIILLDKSIYEYITRQWRGSSDSKILNNLDRIGNQDMLFQPVNQKDWDSLIDEIIENNTIAGESYLNGVDKRIKLLLYYYYVINNIAGPSTSDPNYNGIDIDHIIPQSLFDREHHEDIRELKNHICNLALLPKGVNISKTNAILKFIDNPWLIHQIETYEQIKQEDFEKYSSVDKINELIRYRGNLIKNAIKINRKDIISA